MTLTLEGKVAIITGAASGIGLASLRAFVAAGARVVAADIDSAGLATAVAGLPPGQAIAVSGDVTDAATVEHIVARAISQWGHLDVMFANAGGAAPAATESQTTEDYRRILALNLDSVYFAIRAALPPMLARGKGCFIATSSGAGINAVPGLAVYGAAKAGVGSLMKSVAVEFGARGIRANTIAPGPMDTPGLRAWLETFPDGPARYGAQVPSGRLGTGDDIAQAAVFLASDAASYINGAVIPVDGAVHARLATPRID